MSKNSDEKEPLLKKTNQSLIQSHSIQDRNKSGGGHFLTLSNTSHKIGQFPYTTDSLTTNKEMFSYPLSINTLSDMSQKEEEKEEESVNITDEIIIMENEEGETLIKVYIF